LYGTVKKMAFARNFPPPEGETSWNHDAVRGVAHEFLTGPRATERLVQLALLAVDDRSFTRLLETAVLNWMRDDARRTVVGRQIRRLKDVCASEEDMVVSDHGVRLSSSPDRAYADREDVLVSAALGVSIHRRRWRPDARNEGPEADRVDTAAMVRAVLTVAQRRVAWPQLGRIFAKRFDLIATPVVLDLDALDPPTLSDFGGVDVSDQVAEILDQLTERERDVLPLLDMSSREAAQLLPHGHSTVANVQRKLKDFLATVVRDDAEGAAILAGLVTELSRQRGYNS
jgi:hypothetical protein